MSTENGKSGRSRVTVNRNYSSKTRPNRKKHVPTSDSLEKPKASEQDEVYTFVVSETRYESWLTAIKVRYWFDFGNQDDFLVR